MSADTDRIAKLPQEAVRQDAAVLMESIDRSYFALRPAAKPAAPVGFEIDAILGAVTKARE
jgi:hypothetical protein